MVWLHPGGAKDLEEEGVDSNRADRTPGMCGCESEKGIAQGLSIGWHGGDRGRVGLGTVGAVLRPC